MITRKLNHANLVFFENLKLLQNALQEFTRMHFFRNRSPNEIGELCRMVAEARTQLWEGVKQQFPEAEQGSWSIVNGLLTPNDPEVLK